MGGLQNYMNDKVQRKYGRPYVEAPEISCQGQYP